MQNWTEAALRELDAQVIIQKAQSSQWTEESEQKLRSSVQALLSARGTNPVDSKDIRMALTELGYSTSLPHDVPSYKASKKARFASGWLFLVTIALPIIALCVEVITGMCAGDFFNPIPTWLHGITIALVPICGIYGWICLRKKEFPPLAFIGCGLLLTVSLCYAILFLPMTPVGFLALGFFWYFGIGFLGFLPLSPLFAFLGGLQLLRRGVRTTQSEQWARPVVMGVAAALAMLALANAPTLITRYGISLANSTNSDTHLRGINILRKWCSTDTLGKTISKTSSGRGFSPFNFRGSSANRPTLPSEIFYQVTGQPYYREQWRPSGGGWFGRGRDDSDGFQFDDQLGGDTVGGLLQGLSLTESRLDGTIDGNAGFAYLEWIMVFKNSSWSDREARAQIALPPGAVASRVTLWIDGEERDAAFGSRAQTKQAYKKVVRQRRDPILVTTCGPDRLLVQCFPVPRDGGEMKVRVGLTIPLQVLGKSPDSAALGLPVFVERNFNMDPLKAHTVWLQSATPITLPASGAAALDVTQDAATGSWTAHGDLPNDAGLSTGDLVTVARDPHLNTVWSPAIGNEAFVQQTLQQMTRDQNRLMVVAIDTSLSMESHIDKLADGIASIPIGTRIAVLVAGDKEPSLLLPPTPASADALHKVAETVRELRPEGGRPQLSLLNEAFRLASAEPNSQVIWVHGLVPVLIGQMESLLQKLERSGNGTEIYDLQLGLGPNRIAEALDNLTCVRSLPVTKDGGQVLTRFLGSPDQPQWNWTRQLESGLDRHGTEASRHLARLWAKEEVRHLCTVGDPASREKAVELAQAYAIVTPISGAVVLENEQQYTEGGLTPVDAHSVPTVPEPELWAMLIMVILLISSGSLLRRTKAC